MQMWSDLTYVLRSSFICLISSYDEEADKVNQYQRLSLEGLEKIEIGECV